jgi:hypothetical protein
VARQFGSYSPAVPLGTTWEEELQLLQPDGVTPVDLTGYAVRASLRLEPAARDADTEQGDAPLLELTTPDFYGTAPAWPVIEGWSIPEPTNGTVLLRVDVPDVWKLSPENAKRKLRWSVVLVDATDDDYTLPFVSGRVVALPADTL